MSIVKEIIKNDGFTGLFKGLNAKLLQSVLNSAFIILIYENLNTLLTQILMNSVMASSFYIANFKLLTLVLNIVLYTN